MIIILIKAQYHDFFFPKRAKTSTTKTQRTKLCWCLRQLAMHKSEFHKLPMHILGTVIIGCICQVEIVCKKVDNNGTQIGLSTTPPLNISDPVHIILSPNSTQVDYNLLSDAALLLARHLRRKWGWFTTWNNHVSRSSRVSAPVTQHVTVCSSCLIHFGSSMRPDRMNCHKRNSCKQLSKLSRTKRKQRTHFTLALNSFAFVSSLAPPQEDSCCIFIPWYFNQKIHPWECR